LHLDEFTNVKNPANCYYRWYELSTPGELESGLPAMDKIQSLLGSLAYSDIYNRRTKIVPKGGASKIIRYFFIVDSLLNKILIN